VEVQVEGSNCKWHIFNVWLDIIISTPQSFKPNATLEEDSNGRPLPMVNFPPKNLIPLQKQHPRSVGNQPFKRKSMTYSIILVEKDILVREGGILSTLMY
jgi:hypothetical protein